MTIKNAIPEMIKIRDKYGLSDIDTKNLILIAKNFNPIISLVPINNNNNNKMNIIVNKGD